MVGNSRNSYDVPFRSCLGNSWCRAVNSILIAKLYLNVSRITQFTRNQDETILVIQTHFHWVTSLTGVVFPPSCRPSSFRLGRRRVGSKKVASNRLKIGQRVAQGMGITELDVCNYVSKLLQVQSDLKLTNLNPKVASNQLKIGQQVAHGQAVIAPRAFCARQNSYRFRAI